MRKSTARWIIFTTVILLFVVIMSSIRESSVTINIISSFDGSSLSAEILMESESGDQHTLTTESPVTAKLKSSKYEVTVTSKGSKPISTSIFLDSSHRHELTFTLNPVGLFWGYVRSSINMQLLPGIKVTLSGTDVDMETVTDSDGHFSFSVSGGKLKLTAESDEYNYYENEYYMYPGSEFIESLTLMPTDLSSVHIWGLNSYSMHGRRYGKIAYYSDSTYIKMKKNFKGQYLIEQSYTTSGSVGKSLIFLDGEKAWMAEGKDSIPEEMILQTREFAHATRLLARTNEDLLDYINQLRFTDYAEVTVSGEELINNVLCDVYHVYVNDPGSWMGWADFDFDIYVMKKGRLPGLPTRAVGQIKGRDEMGHAFSMSVDLSLTDIGREFTFEYP